MVLNNEDDIMCGLTWVSVSSVSVSSLWFAAADGEQAILHESWRVYLRHAESLSGCGVPVHVPAAVVWWRSRMSHGCVVIYTINVPNGSANPVCVAFYVPVGLRKISTVKVFSQVMWICALCVNLFKGQNLKHLIWLRLFNLNRV